MFSKQARARGRMITRRTLLSTGFGAGVVSVLAACTTSAPPAPTQAPAAAPTTAAAKPAAAPTQPAAAATQPAKPAAATAAPAAAAPKPAAKTDLGQLVGKLEGATIVTEPAAMPKTFKEAPMLAALVQAGQLPPVEQRLPQDPMVIKQIGRAHV